MIELQDTDWFWTPEWQEGERQADEDIRCGRFTEFNSTDELRDYLDELEDEKR